MLKTILILDDDADTLDLLRLILKGQCTVITERDPGALAPSLSKYAPDLLVLDHLVGGMTSPEILQYLSGQGVHLTIPVILHSGHPQGEQIARSIKAAAFLNKPSGIAEIRRCLLETIKQHDDSIANSSMFVAEENKSQRMYIGTKAR